VDVAPRQAQLEYYRCCTTVASDTRTPVCSGEAKPRRKQPLRLRLDRDRQTPKARTHKNKMQFSFTVRLKLKVCTHHTTRVAATSYVLLCCWELWNPRQVSTTYSSTPLGGASPA